jgi:hypothetical protein
MASSSGLPARGWEMDTGHGVFTEAELAAADQLVQLSASFGGDEEASPSSSLRSVNTAAVAWEEEEVVVDEEEELDRRARKRYRLLSDLYAATRPPTGASKRKRHVEPDGKAAMARYGDQSW